MTPWTVAHRLLCLWDSLGKNIGSGFHTFLQGIFLTHIFFIGRWILYHCNWETLNKCKWVEKKINLPDQRLVKYFLNKQIIAQGTCNVYERKSQVFSVQFSSVAQSCLTLCDPMDCSMQCFPVHHQLPEFTQTHVHRVSDAIQPSHPLSSPSLPAINLSQ